jgi:hypothetical protein
MITGAAVTRATIWLALLCYVTTIGLQTRASLRATLLARFIWIGGCLIFLAHVAAAFHFYHHWSHVLAENDTRLQTIERTGLNFGGGIYFNYLLGLMWLADCAGWPLRGKHLHESLPRWRFVLHIYFLFMIFNATVMFGHGWARPAGAILCTLALSGLFLRARFPT